MSARGLSDIASLLQRYYAHDLAKIDPSAWDALLEMADGMAAEYPSCAEALVRIVNAPANDKDQFEYEFNRLFVGPGRPECPPYETIYVAEDDTLMRETSKRLRRAYLEAGLQPDLKNIEPDDHFAFEMAFVAWLLDKTPELNAMLKDFTEQHLDEWAFAHVTSVRNATENEVCLGFAQLLESMVSEVDRLVSKEMLQEKEEEEM